MAGDNPTQPLFPEGMEYGRVEESTVNGIDLEELDFLDYYFEELCKKDDHLEEKTQQEQENDQETNNKYLQIEENIGGDNLLYTSSNNYNNNINNHNKTNINNDMVIESQLNTFNGGASLLDNLFEDSTAVFNGKDVTIKENDLRGFYDQGNKSDDISNEEKTIKILNYEEKLINQCHILKNSTDHTYCQEDLTNNYNLKNSDDMLLGQDIMFTSALLSQDKLSQISLKHFDLQDAINTESTMDFSFYNLSNISMKNEITDDMFTENYSQHCGTTNSLGKTNNNNNNLNNVTNKNTPANESSIGKRQNGNLKIDLSRTNIIPISQIDISTPDICDNILSLEDERLRKLMSPSDASTEDELPQVEIIVNKVNKVDQKDEHSITPISSPYNSSFHETSLSSPPPSPSIISGYQDEFIISVSSSNTSFAEPSTPSTVISENTSESSSNYNNTEFEQPQKKRRGRPPKTHSAIPDPKELNLLNDKDRKYREQRYKNNEASRQSRLNRKRKENQAEKQLEDQENKNQFLLEKRRKLEKAEMLLKDYMKRMLSRK